MGAASASVENPRRQIPAQEVSALLMRARFLGGLGFTDNILLVADRSNRDYLLAGRSAPNNDPCALRLRSGPVLNFGRRRLLWR